MNSTVSLILSELGQSSTYTNLALMLGVVGVKLPAGTLQTITFAGMAASALASIIIKEGWQQAATSGDAVAALQAELAALKAAPPSK